MSLGTMSSRLIINGRSAEATPESSLFDLAESLSVHVPTSCHKQGKCRECLVEIESGAELLSPPEPQEDHLPEGFRLENAEVGGEKIQVANQKETATVRIVPSATKTVEWKMTFAK